MLKSIIEEAIAKMQAEKAQKVAVVKDKITREKIAPYNAQIEQARAVDLQKLDSELATKITEIKTEYEARKQAVIKRVDEEKQKNAEAMLATEIAVVAVDYDNAIAKLTEQLNGIEE